YPSPRLSMRRSVKVATPPAAATVVVPERVPPPASLKMPTVMLLLAFGIGVPDASRIATSIVGVIDTPSAAPLGCTLKARLGPPPPPPPAPPPPPEPEEQPSSFQQRPVKSIWHPPHTRRSSSIPARIAYPMSV